MLWSLFFPSALAGPNTILVGVHHPDDLTALRAAVAQQGGQVGACYRQARFCVAELQGPPTADQLQRLQGVPGVRYVEADQRIEPVGQQGSGAPADAAGTTDCPDLWDIEAVELGAGWTLSGAAPVIAIADAGFRQSHEEIRGQISGQFDYGNGDADAELEWDAGVPAHGTFIAAIVAGKGDNGAGRAGIIPGGALNLLKIADSTGALYYSYAAAALADVADGDLGIGVVNYSIASSSTTTSFREAVAALESVGVVLVAAAGNCGSAHCSDADNDTYPLYPASLTDAHILSVAGATRDGGVNSYSHYGATSVDLAAPGVDICSADVSTDADYAVAGGTSYAAPMVAAAAGLVMGAHPDLTPGEVVRVIRASAQEQPAWSGRTRSGGVLDISAALQVAVPRLSLPLLPAAIDGIGALDVLLENPGAEGVGYLLLGHGAGVSVEDAGGWSVTPYGPGTVLTLPDAGAVTLTDSGSLLVGSLEAHGSQTLRVVLAGRVQGHWPTTVRLIATSAGADYLNAPYGEGVEDETGFLALSVSLEVTGVIEEDSGGGGGGGASQDSRAPLQPDSATLEDSAGGAEGAPDRAGTGCGCGAGASPSGGSGLVGVLLLGVLGRRRAGGGMATRWRVAG